MIQQISEILPVPVLHESAPERVAETTAVRESGEIKRGGEARESTNLDDNQCGDRSPQSDSRGGQIHLSGGVESRHATCLRDGNAKIRPTGESRSERPSSGSSVPPAQTLSDDAELGAWLETLPRKTRFMLAMSVSALSLEKGQCRPRDDLVCFLAAAGLPVSRQAIENIECRALRKCRRSELAMIAREHLTTK